MIVAAGLSLARQSGAGALNTIYAEDGSVFLGSSYADSTLHSITTPYAGYLHVVPRLLSELVSALPVSWAAAGLSIAAAVVTGLLALLVYACTNGYLAPWGRIVASAVVVLVPVGQDELPNSIANLHWPMLYALFWVLLTRRLNETLAIVAVLLISLSDLLVLVYVPLALWLWWQRRDRRSLALGLALLVGLAAQAAAVLFGPSGRQLHPEPVKWAPWYVLRAVPEAVWGQRWFGSNVDSQWLVLAALAWLIVIGAALYAWRVARNASARPSYALTPRLPAPAVRVSALARSASASAGGVSASVDDVSTGGTSASAGDLSPLAGGVSVSDGGGGAGRGRGATFAMARVRQAGREFWTSEPAGWRLAVLAALYSVAVYALPVALSGQATPRYAAASTMLLVTAACALFLPAAPVKGWAPITKTAIGTWAGVALVAFCLVVWAVNFRVPNERGKGPLWTDQVAKACTATAATAEVPITPAGWEVNVPCPR